MISFGWGDFAYIYIIAANVEMLSQKIVGVHISEFH